MTSVSELVHAVPPAIRRHKNRIYGFAPGIVIAVWDPKNAKRHEQGYVQVYFPGMQLEKDHVESARSDPEKGVSALRDHEPLVAPWARVATPELGLHCIPQLGDEVLCAFEHGDPHHAYVVGVLYNGGNPIPKPVTNPDVEKNRPQGCPATPDMSNDAMAASDGGSNKVMFWRSRTGNLIAFNDQTGQIRLADRSGQSTIQLNDQRIDILQSAKDIRVNAKNKVTFDCTDFIVNAKKCITKNTSRYIATAGADFCQSAQATLTMASKGSFTTTAAKDWTVFSKDKVEVKAKSGAMLFTVAGDLGIVAPKGKTSVESQNIMALVTPLKFAMGAKCNLKIKGDAVVSINAGINATFKGANCLVNCGADAGFSLFDWIWNGLKKIGTAVVKGVIGAAKWAAGAVVAGATALGRAAVSAMAAVTRVAGAAARAVVRVGRKVATTAWDVTRSVASGMYRVGRAAGSAAMNAARAGARAVNTAAHNVGRAAVRAGRAVQEGLTQAGRAVIGGVGTGLVAAGSAVSRAGQGMQNAGRALASTNTTASNHVIRSAGAGGLTGGSANGAVNEAALALIATVNRGNRIILEATGNSYRREIEAIVRESEAALEQVAEISGFSATGARENEASGAIAIDLEATSAPIAHGGAENDAPVTRAPQPSEEVAELPVVTTSAGHAQSMTPTILPGAVPRMASQVHPGMRDLSGRMMPQPVPSAGGVRPAEARSF